MPELSDATYRQIAALMHETVGLSFSDSKKALVSARLSQRVQQLSLDSFDAYLGRITTDADAAEFQVAVDLLTTNETYFFREPQHFELLEQELNRLRPQSLSVWSAASSFGDEAYSIAMLLSDLQQQGRLGSDWSILGTDISDRVLRSARQAVYPEARLRFVSPQRLKRYCLRGEGEVLGTKQSGSPDWRIARPEIDGDLLAAARDDARLLIERDPHLETPRGQAIRVLLYLFERDVAIRLLRAG